jgi:hypothetical protein
MYDIPLNSIIMFDKDSLNLEIQLRLFDSIPYRFQHDQKTNIELI